MTDAAAIARRLTSAQKRALLWLPGDGSATDGLTLRGVRYRTMRILSEACLCGVGGGWGWHATSTGLAVRAELERMEAGDA